MGDGTETVITNSQGQTGSYLIGAPADALTSLRVLWTPAEITAPLQHYYRSVVFTAPRSRAI